MPICGSSRRVSVPATPLTPNVDHKRMSLFGGPSDATRGPACVFIDLSTREASNLNGVSPSDRIAFVCHRKSSRKAKEYFECARSDPIEVSDSATNCQIIAPMVKMWFMKTQVISLKFEIFTVVRNDLGARVGHFFLEHAYTPAKFDKEAVIETFVKRSGDRTSKSISEGVPITVKLRNGHCQPEEVSATMVRSMKKLFASIDMYTSKLSSSVHSGARILATLEALDPTSFNHVCQSKYIIKVAHQLDHNHFGRKRNKIRFIKLLLERFTEGVLSELSKRKIIDALSQCESILLGQQVVCRIIMSYSGQELSDTKRLLDVEGQYNLSHIIFEFITNEDLQAEVLEHIVNNASQLLETPNFKRPVVILSDIDDTLVQSGFGLGGPKYPSGTVMPGYKSLIYELDARVVFITARPGFVARATYTKLQEYGIDNPNVLTGVLTDSLLIPFLPKQSNEWISERKFQNYKRYVQIFPEVSFQWWGDTGQGDVEMGIKMLKSQRKNQTNIDGIYIQDVVKSDGITFKTDTIRRQEMTKRGVVIADGYANVALDLYRKGQLSIDSLRKIADSCVTDLLEVWPKCQEKEGKKNTESLLDKVSSGVDAIQNKILKKEQERKQQMLEMEPGLLLKVWDARVVELTKAINQINDVLQKEQKEVVDVSKLGVRGPEYAKYKFAVAEAKDAYSKAIAKATAEFMATGLQKEEQDMDDNTLRLPNYPEMEPESPRLPTAQNELVSIV